MFFFLDCSVVKKSYVPFLIVIISYDFMFWIPVLEGNFENELTLPNILSCSGTSFFFVLPDNLCFYLDTQILFCVDYE